MMNDDLGNIQSNHQEDNLDNTNWNSSPEHIVHSEVVTQGYSSSRVAGEVVIVHDHHEEGDTHHDHLTAGGDDDCSACGHPVIVPETPLQSSEPVNLTDHNVSIEGEPQHIVQEVDHDTVGCIDVAEASLKSSKTKWVGDEKSCLNKEDAEIKDVDRFYVVFVLQVSLHQEVDHQYEQRKVGAVSQSKFKQILFFMMVSNHCRYVSSKVAHTELGEKSSQQCILLSHFSSFT